MDINSHSSSDDDHHPPVEPPPPLHPHPSLVDVKNALSESNANDALDLDICLKRAEEAEAIAVKARQKAIEATAAHERAKIIAERHALSDMKSLEDSFQNVKESEKKAVDAKVDANNKKDFADEVKIFQDIEVIMISAEEKLQHASLEVSNASNVVRCRVQEHEKLRKAALEHAQRVEDAASAIATAESAKLKAETLLRKAKIKYTLAEEAVNIGRRVQQAHEAYDVAIQKSQVANYAHLNAQTTVRELLDKEAKIRQEFEDKLKNVRSEILKANEEKDAFATAASVAVENVTRAKTVLLSAKKAENIAKQKAENKALQTSENIALQKDKQYESSNSNSDKNAQQVNRNFWRSRIKDGQRRTEAQFRSSSHRLRPIETTETPRSINLGEQVTPRRHRNFMSNPLPRKPNIPKQKRDNPNPNLRNPNPNVRGDITPLSYSSFEGDFKVKHENLRIPDNFSPNEDQTTGVTQTRNNSQKKFRNFINPNIDKNLSIASALRVMLNNDV